MTKTRKAYLIMKGIASHTPYLFNHLQNKLQRKGNAASAAYCYKVWLTHLTKAHETGLNTRPEVVIELGPGASNGTGIAAKHTGVTHYYGIDTYTPSYIIDARIGKEIETLFAQKKPIPDHKAFPRFRPLLDDYSFPTFLQEDMPTAQKVMRYNSWDDTREESADMILSHAVMEHVDNIEYHYKKMHSRLKKGGYMQHHIDFGSHRNATEWNGHWAYDDRTWKLMLGARKNFLNRHTYADHKKAIEKAGFTIVYAERELKHDGIKRAQLKGRYKTISDEDLQTKSVFLQAVKQ